MSTISIATELAEQYERAWRMFRAAVELFSEDQWRAGAISSLVPARHACHVVETADFYCASVPPDEFKWGSRVGGFWDTAPARNLPSQEHVLEFQRLEKHCYENQKDHRYGNAQKHLGAPKDGRYVATPQAGPQKLDFGSRRVLRIPGFKLHPDNFKEI